MIAEREAQLTGDMFKSMDIKDEIHRLKIECAGVSCEIDDPGVRLVEVKLLKINKK